MLPFPGGGGDGNVNPVELIFETFDMRGVFLVEDVQHEVVPLLLALSILPERRYVINAAADDPLEIMMVLRSGETLDVLDLVRVITRVELGPVVSR